MTTRQIDNISRAKAQRRKALPRFHGFLCVFAPLRESFYVPISFVIVGIQDSSADYGQVLPSSRGEAQTMQRIG
jgi:hypothetical protein